MRTTLRHLQQLALLEGGAVSVRGWTTETDRRATLKKNIFILLIIIICWRICELGMLTVSGFVFHVHCFIGDPRHYNILLTEGRRQGRKSGQLVHGAAGGARGGEGGAANKRSVRRSSASAKGFSHSRPAVRHAARQLTPSRAPDRSIDITIITIIIFVIACPWGWIHKTLTWV